MQDVGVLPVKPRTRARSSFHQLKSSIEIKSKTQLQAEQRPKTNAEFVWSHPSSSHIDPPQSRPGSSTPQFSGSSDSPSELSSTKRRSRSHTASSIATTVTRPSTSTERSFLLTEPTSTHLFARPSSERARTAPTSPHLSGETSILYSLPHSKSATELSSNSSQSDLATPATQTTPNSWKSVVRKASGKFRRSLSSTNVNSLENSNYPLSTTPQSTKLTSPKRDRSRTVSENPPHSSDDAANPGIFNHILRRQKSNGSLKAEKRKQAWQDLPPSPQTFGNQVTERKAAGLNKKGKQKLEDVVISPFEILSLEVPALGTFRRSSSEHSFPQRTQPGHIEIPRSISVNTLLDGGSHTDCAILSSSPISSCSSAGGFESPEEYIPPVPPLPAEHLFTPRSQASHSLDLYRPSTGHSSPSLDVMPHATSPSRLRFPSTFGFVPRLDDVDGRDEVFGSGANAASTVPIFITRSEPETKRPLSKSAPASASNSYQPPRRFESLMKPLETKSARTNTGKVEDIPKVDIKVSKLRAFEDLLGENRTVKLSLTPLSAKYS